VEECSSQALGRVAFKSLAHAVQEENRMAQTTELKSGPSFGAIRLARIMTAKKARRVT